MILNAPARRCRLFAGCLSALIVAVFISSSALAQSDSNPKWDAFIGYQYLHPEATVPAFGNPVDNPVARDCHRR